MASGKTIRVIGGKRKGETGAEIYKKGKVTTHYAPLQSPEDALLTHSDEHYTSAVTSHSHVPQSGSHSVRVEVTETEEDAIRHSEYIDRKIKVSEEWAKLRKDMAGEIVCNAFPSTNFICSVCKCTVDSMYRCLDCGPSAYFCEKCFEVQHSIVFLHLPEKWNPDLHCFQNCTNYKVWTRPDGHLCKDTTTTHVIIFDDKGRQHYQGLQVCSCQPLPVIMLKYCLWPASPLEPHVAFTLDFMHTLRCMVLEGHMSLHAFCSAIQKCRPGLKRDRKNELVQNLYRVLSWETVLNFMWVHHHVSYLQFAGVFPDGTKCNSCPKDDIGSRIAMDGNMNLVHRAKAGYSIRNAMHEGRFFLPQSSVDSYLDEHKDTRTPEEQTCSRFQAGSVIRAKNKTAKLDVTGVFASVCSHDFPCALFNMRHGERMGYPIYMMQTFPKARILLYDIGCQLTAVLMKRNIEWTATLGVPVFHIHGHRMKCQLEYSPRTIQDAGLFDGEGTERLWSYLGKFATITKEMTLENRQDLITEGLLYYGQRLAIKMGETLSEKLGKAYLSRDMSNKTLKDELALFSGLTVSDVDAWSTEEKIMAQKKQEKTKKDPWEETYSLRLHQYYTHCQEEGGYNPNEETARLEALVTGMERRWKIKDRWTQDSELYKHHLKKACAEQRMTKLHELRDTVVQYNFMARMKSKYSKGQSLRNRIVRQVQEASKKVNNALDAYNRLPNIGADNPLPPHLVRCDVTPLQAAIWQYLAPDAPGPDDIPVANRRRMIDAFNLSMRSEEEIELTSRDLAQHMKNLLLQVEQLDARIAELESMEERTRFQEGCLAMLVVERYRTYASQNIMVQINDKIKKSINTDEYFKVLSDQESNPDVAEIMSMIAAVEEETEFDQCYDSEM